MAQLVERSLPIPEVRGSNPIIDKKLYLYWTFVYCQLCIEKTKIKKKRPGMAHLKKLPRRTRFQLRTSGNWSSNWDAAWFCLCWQFCKNDVWQRLTSIIDIKVARLLLLVLALLFVINCACELPSCNKKQEWDGRFVPARLFFLTWPSCVYGWVDEW